MLAPEREKEIREGIEWEQDLGFIKRELLAEIDRLREECEQHRTYEYVRVLVIKDQKQKLAVAENALELIARTHWWYKNDLKDDTRKQMALQALAKIRGGK